MLVLLRGGVEFTKSYSSVIERLCLIPLSTAAEDEVNQLATNAKSFEFVRDSQIVLPLGERNGQYVFGRKPSCDFPFIHDDKKRLSNKHFTINVNEAGQPVIRDLSTNGTYINSKHVEKTTEIVLSNDDSISIWLEDGKVLEFKVATENVNCPVSAPLVLCPVNDPAPTSPKNPTCSETESLSNIFSGRMLFADIRYSTPFFFFFDSVVQSRQRRSQSTC